jgi:hypothetical protein
LIEINDDRGSVLLGQLCLVLMWCSMVDTGAHHMRRPLLQALFITASVLTAMSTTATRTMTKGLFMGDLATRPICPNFHPLKMNRP